MKGIGLCQQLSGSISCISPQGPPRTLSQHMASIPQWPYGPYGYCLRMPVAPGFRQNPQVWQKAQALLVQQGLRYEAQEFVPSKPTAVYSTTPLGNPLFMFAGPSASVGVGAGCSKKSTEDCGENSCSDGAVQPEASLPEGEDEVHFGAQTTPQKKSGKRLMNARLPLKRQGAKQQEVSCLPAEEWGLQALDAVEATAQSRSLETEIAVTLQAKRQGSKDTAKSKTSNMSGRGHEQIATEQSPERMSGRLKERRNHRHA